MKLKRISQDTNFVLPLESDDGTKWYAHSSPISQEVFEEYSMPLAKTFAAIHAEGLGNISGPRVAAITLRHIGRDMNIDPLINRLFAEMHRLTNVIVPGDNGWETVPLEECLRRDYLDKEDVSEIDNALVFFTLAWRMYNRNIRPKMIIGASMLWGGFVTPSNCTEYAAFLQKSTTEENSKTAKTSSTPS